MTPRQKLNAIFVKACVKFWGCVLWLPVAVVAQNLRPICVLTSEGIMIHVQELT